MKKRILKIFKAFMYLAFLGFVSLVILELSYRNYWFDFYDIQLTGLNSASELNNPEAKPTILVLGDSFSQLQKMSFAYITRKSWSKE